MQLFTPSNITKLKYHSSVPPAPSTWSVFVWDRQIRHTPAPPETFQSQIFSRCCQNQLDSCERQDLYDKSNAETKWLNDCVHNCRRFASRLHHKHLSTVTHGSVNEWFPLSVKMFISRPNNSGSWKNMSVSWQTNTHSDGRKSNRKMNLVLVTDCEKMGGLIGSLYVHRKSNECALDGCFYL